MDAEKILIEKVQGSYLVRVSEKVWGYTISYRAIDRCKHFLIDASEEQYHFFGPNQLTHNSIIDLVDYHKVWGMFVDHRLAYKMFVRGRVLITTVSLSLTRVGLYPPTLTHPPLQKIN